MRQRKKHQALPLGLAYETSKPAVLEAWRLTFLQEVQSHCWWVVNDLGNNVLPRYTKRYRAWNVKPNGSEEDFHFDLKSEWKANPRNQTDELRESIDTWITKYRFQGIEYSDWDFWLLTQVLHVCHGWMVEDEPRWASGDIPSWHMSWAHLLKQTSPPPRGELASFQYREWCGEPLERYEADLTRLLDLQKTLALERARSRAGAYPKLAPMLRPERFAALALHLCLTREHREHARTENLIASGELGHAYARKSARVLRDDLRELKRLLGLSYGLPFPTLQKLHSQKRQKSVNPRNL